MDRTQTSARQGTGRAAPVTASRIRPRRRLVAGLALAIVVIAASVFIWLRLPHEPAAPQGPYPTVLTFAHDPIACPAAAAWSPDSAHIAVIGFSACPQEPLFPASGPVSSATLTIYSSKTGQPGQTTNLSQVIAAKALPASVRGDASALGEAQVLYGALLWSPDGQRVAFGFATFHTDPSGNGQADAYVEGLFVVPESGTPRAFVAPAAGIVQPAEDLSSTSAAPLSLTRFDLTSGAATSVTTPQALAYAWSANGALNATQPLASAPSTIPLAATGNPYGGATFTVWQSGSLGYGSSCTGAVSSPTCCTDTSYLTATFGAAATWSPDGRYVVLQPASGGVTIGAMGKVSAPPVDDASVPGACAGAQPSSQYAAIPVRDAGLQAGLRAFDLSRVGIVVAWSPNGQRIAVRADHSLDGTAHELSIYDCRTGKLLGSYSAEQVEHGLPANRGNTVQFGIGLPPVWSPDSTHLLILDNDLRVLSILGPNMLGQ